MTSSTTTLIVVISVPLFFMTLGLLYARRYRSTLEEYISARGTTGVATGTATIVATAMGAWLLFSPAETATFGGLIGLLGYALGSAAPILALTAIGSKLRHLMPEGHSLTEYVWHRYGMLMYCFALIVMVFYMFVFLSAELTAIALAVNLIAGTPLVLTAGVLGIATLAYTTYGGLRATIFTDMAQLLVIVPLLFVVLVNGLLGLGGISAVLEAAHDRAPALVSIAHPVGWETGLALIVGILAANLFHQGYWQRVYACRDDVTLRRALYISVVFVVPMVGVAGLFGIMAVGADIVDHPSTALFAVVQETMPGWLVLGVLILAVALVMSSVDSLLNGLVSSFTSDLYRARPQISTKQLLLYARAATVIIALFAIMIATQGFSVLYLFLISDLVAAAVVVPVFLGMYVRHYNGKAAIISSLIGLMAGGVFFPAPDFTGWLDIPKAGSLMVSFLAAVGSSTFVAGSLALIAAWRGLENGYDFEELQRVVRRIPG